MSKRGRLRMQVSTSERHRAESVKITLPTPPWEQEEHRDEMDTET